MAPGILLLETPLCPTHRQLLLVVVCLPAYRCWCQSPPPVARSQAHQGCLPPPLWPDYHLLLQRTQLTWQPCLRAA